MPYQEIPEDPSLADPLPDEPTATLSRWFDEAQVQSARRNPLAMTLATLDSAKQPTARMVLCRGYEPDPGFVVFYTNRNSAKAEGLVPGMPVALVFHWDDWQRQVRISGPVQTSPDAESDTYFAGRPRPAQIAAWASAQSEPIGSRAQLLEALAHQESKFGQDPTAPPVPRPPFWGGYRVYFECVELWVGAEGRVHDRALWQRELVATQDGYRPRAWSVARLQP